METIGRQIRNQRKELKLSQNDLREKLGLKSVNTIQAWEADKGSTISLHTRADARII